MAITSIDQLIAGFQPARFYCKRSVGQASGRGVSWWTVGGIPGAGTISGSGSGTVLSSTGGLVDGQLPFFNPTGGQSYLGRFSANTFQAAAARVLLCDRLWHSGGFSATSSSSQTVGSPTWPTRDNNGAISGEGVLIGAEVTSLFSNNNPTLQITYTNSAGAGSRTGSVEMLMNSAAVASFLPFELAAGDLGVQSVQSVQVGASGIFTSGVFALVAYRVLASIECPEQNGCAVDAMNSGMLPLYNGTVPYMISLGALSASPQLTGMFTQVNG